MSIKEKGRKINDTEDLLVRLRGRVLGHKYFTEIAYSLLIIMVAIISFSLGVLAERENSNNREIRVINQSASAGSSIEDREDTVVIPDKDPGGYVVGSVNSDKYHFPWCSGAKRINEANKIWFKSIEEARNKGYSPAGNCEGLR